MDEADEFIKKAKRKEYQDRYRLKNKDKIAQRQLENKDKIKEKSQKWYLKNKDIVIERSKKWALENKEKRQEIVRKNYLSKKYGLTLEQEIAMKLAQNNSCAICKIELLPRHKTHIDHCHKTGKVREILCNNCNVMLGHAKDSEDILKSALAYLEKHKI